MLDFHRLSNRRRRLARCRGAATVELAVTLPILLLFVFTSVEFARMNMIRHSVDNAAYEGARRGMLPGATTQDVERAVANVLNSVGARGGRVVVTPTDLAVKSDTLQVQVTVDASRNGFIAPNFFRNKILGGTSTMRRETL